MQLPKTEFGAPRRVIFGEGEFARLGQIASEYGHRAAIVATRSAMKPGGAAEIAGGLLKENRIEFTHFEIAGEPTVSDIDALTKRAREFQPDLIIGLGGGSALDAAKAVGALITNAEADQSVLDFLEGVGKGSVISKPSLPVIAIPTTSGTGSEATKNSVVRSDVPAFKKSMRSIFMRPEVALVDPARTRTLPREPTAAGGMDAVTQLIESLVSSRASILTDGLAWQGLELAAWALERAVANPADREARSAMSMAALLSGMTLDNAGLGAVHGLAAPIGGLFDIPHGVVCANLLPSITAANIHLARVKSGEDEIAHRAILRYRRIACLFNGGFDCEAEELVVFLSERLTALKLPNFKSYGMDEASIPKIIAGCRGGSMRTNPVELSDEILSELLTEQLKT